MSLLKSNFELSRGGHVIGKLITVDWAAWDFSFRDAWGNEVAQINKQYAGFFQEVMFDTADNYMVQMFQFRDESLRPLVLAASVAMDSALRQV